MVLLSIASAGHLAHVMRMQRSKLPSPPAVPAPIVVKLPPLARIQDPASWMLVDGLPQIASIGLDNRNELIHLVVQLHHALQLHHLPTRKAHLPIRPQLKFFEERHAWHDSAAALCAVRHTAPARRE